MNADELMFEIYIVIENRMILTDIMTINPSGISFDKIIRWTSLKEPRLNVFFPVDETKQMIYITITGYVLQSWLSFYQYIQ